MVDMDKISRTVKNAVKDIMKDGGNKRKIDTQAEYDNLAKYLNGSASQLNQHEEKYLNELMDEFVKEEESKKTKEAQKKADNAITKDTKTLVKQIKRQQLDKKKIDIDVEARDLATLLNNSNGDLNAADLEYIKNLLKESGYEQYIPSESEQQNTEPAPNSDKPVDDKKGTDTDKTKPAPTPKPVDDKPGTDTDKTKPAPTPKPVNDKPVNVIFDSGSSKISARLADNLRDELNSGTPNPKKIEQYLKDASKQGYTFFTTFNAGTTDPNFMAAVFSKKYNRITLKDVVGPINGLLKHAEKMKLQNSDEYKELYRLYTAVITNFNTGLPTRPTEEQITKIDNAIVKLCNKMEPYAKYGNVEKK